MRIVRTEKLDLLARTKAYAVRIVKVYKALPKTVEAQVIGKQLLRSGTSVGAHVAEANRARSTAEFVSKVEGGLMELAESRYWMELLVELEIVAATKMRLLLRETDELTAILVAMAHRSDRNKSSK